MQKRFNPIWYQKLFFSCKSQKHDDFFINKGPIQFMKLFSTKFKNEQQGPISKKIRIVFMHEFVKQARYPKVNIFKKKYFAVYQNRELFLRKQWIQRQIKASLFI